MVFPFWYTGEAVFYKSDEEDSAGLINNIVLNNNGENDYKGYYVFKAKVGLFRLHTFVKLKFDTLGPTIHVKYFTSLFESNIILLFGLVLGLFLFINDKFLLSSIFFVLGVLGYFGNAIIANNYAKGLLLPLGSLLLSIEEQELWENQKLWTTNPDVCSACGEMINPYAVKCVNCGLNFTKNRKQNLVLPTNSTSNAQINIELKKD